MRRFLIIFALALSACNAAPNERDQFKVTCLDKIKDELVAPSTMKLIEFEMDEEMNTSGVKGCPPDFGFSIDSILDLYICVGEDTETKPELSTTYTTYYASVTLDAANRFNAPIRHEFSCTYLHDEASSEPVNFQFMGVKQNDPK